MILHNNSTAARVTGKQYIDKNLKDMTTAVAPKKTYELVAIFFLIPALYIQSKWLNVFYGSGTSSPSARTSSYLGDFPDFFSVRSLAFLCLAFAVLAIVFASKSFNQPKVFWRVSSFIVVLIGSLITLLCLFQMI